MKSVFVAIFIIVMFVHGLGSTGLVIPSDLSHLAAAGTSEQVEDTNISTLPDRIDLSFHVLNLEELKSGKPAAEWKFIQSFPFGSVKQDQMVFHIYDESPTDEMLPKQINGVLQVDDEQYLLRDISQSLVGDDAMNGCKICVFQRLFSGQNQVELIGSIELFSNGPGRKLFIVHDGNTNMLHTFESWGDPSFLDLDADDLDEFIIEFPGLHMSWPDLSMIRVEQGRLESSSSVMNSVSRNQGDYAKLIRDRESPRIKISNVESEEDSMYYTYHQGKLYREK